MDNAVGPSAAHLRLRHESLAERVASSGRVATGANALPARDQSKLGARIPSVGGVESPCVSSREDGHWVQSALDLRAALVCPYVSAGDTVSADMPKGQQERCTDTGLENSSQDFIPSVLITDRTHLSGDEQDCIACPSAGNSESNTPLGPVAPVAVVVTGTTTTPTTAYAVASAAPDCGSRAVLRSTGRTGKSPIKKTCDERRLSGARCSCASPLPKQRCRSIVSQFLLYWRNKRRSSRGSGGVCASEERSHDVREKVSLSRILFAHFSAVAPVATAAGYACRSAHRGVTDTKHNYSVPQRLQPTAVSKFIQRLLPLILFCTLVHSSPRVSVPVGQPFSGSTGTWQSTPLLLARAQPAGFPGGSFEGHQRTAYEQLPRHYGQYTQHTYTYPRGAGHQWWPEELSKYPQEGSGLQNPPPTVHAQQEFYAPHTDAARHYADQFLSSIKEYYTGNSEGPQDWGTVPGAARRQYISPEQQLEYATQLHLAQQQYHTRPYDHDQLENGTPQQNATQDHYYTSYGDYPQASYSRLLHTTPEQHRTDQQVHVPEVQHYTGDLQNPGSLLYDTRHPQPQYHSERQLQSQHHPTNFYSEVHPQQRHSDLPGVTQDIGHNWSQPYVKEVQPRFNDQGTEQVNHQHQYYTDYAQEDRRAQQRVHFSVDQSQAYDYGEQRNNSGHPQGSYLQRTTDQVYMNGEPYHPAEPGTPQPQPYSEYVYTQHQPYDPSVSERLEVHSYGQQSGAGHFNDSRRSLDQLHPQVQQSTHQGYNIAGGDSARLQRYGKEVPYPSAGQQHPEVHYPRQHYVGTPTISEERHCVKEFCSPPVQQYTGQAGTLNDDENPYDEYPSAAQAATQQLYGRQPRHTGDLPSVTQQQFLQHAGSAQPRLTKQQRAPQELHLSAKLTLPSRKHHEKQAVDGKPRRHENPYSESTQHDSQQQGDFRPRSRPVEEVQHRPERQPRRGQAHRRLVRLKSQHSVVETSPSVNTEQEQQHHKSVSTQEDKQPADTPAKKYYDEEDSASEEEPAEEHRVDPQLQAGTSERDPTTPQLPTETSENFSLQGRLPGPDEKSDLETHQTETVQREVQQSARATLQKVSGSSKELRSSGKQKNQVQRQDTSIRGDWPQYGHTEDDGGAGDEPSAQHAQVEHLSHAKGEVVHPVKDSLRWSSSASLQNRPAYPEGSVTRRLSSAEALDYYASLEQQERRHYPEVSAFPVKQNESKGEQQNPEGELKQNGEQGLEDVAAEPRLRVSLDDVKEGQRAGTPSVPHPDDSESTDEETESEEEDDEELDAEEQEATPEGLNPPNEKQGQRDTGSEDHNIESAEEADDASDEEEEDEEENEESELEPGDDDEQDPASAARGQDNTRVDLDTLGKEEGAEEPSSELARPTAGNEEADVPGSTAVVDKQNTAVGGTDNVGEKAQKTETDAETPIPEAGTPDADAQGDLDNPKDGVDDDKKFDGEAKILVTDLTAANGARNSGSEGGQHDHDEDGVEGKVAETIISGSNTGSDSLPQKQEAKPLETKQEVSFFVPREEEKPTDSDVPVRPADWSEKGADEKRDSDLACDRAKGKRNDGYLVDQPVIDSKKGLHPTNNQDPQSSQELTLTKGEEKAEKQRDGKSLDPKDEQHVHHGKGKDLLTEEAQPEGEEAEAHNEERAADAEGDEWPTREAPHTQAEGKKLNKEDNREFEEPAVGRRTQTVEHQNPVETKEADLGGVEQSQDPRSAELHKVTTTAVKPLEEAPRSDLLTDAGNPEPAERTNPQGEEGRKVETKQTLETAVEEEDSSGQHDKEPHQAEKEQKTKGLLTIEEKLGRQEQQKATEGRTEATLATQENGNRKSVETVKDAGVIDLSQNTSAEGQPEGLKEQESNERKEEGAPADTVNQAGEGVVEQVENTTAHSDQGEQAGEAPQQHAKEDGGGVQREGIQAAAHVREDSSETSLPEGAKRLEGEEHLTPEPWIEKTKDTGADNSSGAATHVAHETEVSAASAAKDVLAAQSQTTSVNGEESSGEPKSEGLPNNDLLRFPHAEQIGDSSFSAGKAEEDKEQTTWLGHNGEVTENLPFDSLPSHTAGETTSPEARRRRRERPLSWAVTEDKNITTDKEEEARKTEEVVNEEGSDSDEGGHYESLSSAVPGHASPEANTTDHVLGAHGALVPGLLFHSRDPPFPVKLDVGKAAYKQGRQNGHENSTDGDPDTLSAVQREVQRLGERDREKQPQFPNKLKRFRDKVDHEEDDALFGSNDGALDPIAYSTLPPGAATRHKRHGHKRRTWKLMAAAKASRQKSKPFRDAAGLRRGESLAAQVLRGDLPSARTFDAAVTEQKSEVLEDLADKAMKRGNGELVANERSPSNFIRRTLAYRAAKAAAAGGKEDSDPEPYLLLPRQSERIAAAEVTTATGLPTDDFSAVRTIDQVLHADDLYPEERARQRQQRRVGPTMGPGPAAFLPHFIYRPPEEETALHTHMSTLAVPDVPDLQEISADVTSHVDKPLHPVPETPATPEARPVTTVPPEIPNKVVADVASNEIEYEEPVSPGAALTNSRLASTLSNQTAAAEQARAVPQQRGFDFVKSGHGKQNDEGIEGGENMHQSDVAGDQIEKRSTQEFPLVKKAETDNHHAGVRHRGADVQAAAKTPRTNAAFARLSVSQAVISGPLLTVGWLLFTSL